MRLVEHPRPPAPPDADVRALGAQADYFANRTVALWQTPSGGGSYIGRATCVQISERLLLATAGHNLEGIERPEELEVVGPLPDGRRIDPLRWEPSAKTGDTPDVGWIA